MDCYITTNEIQIEFNQNSLKKDFNFFLLRVSNKRSLDAALRLVLQKAKAIAYYRHKNLLFFVTPKTILSEPIEAIELEDLPKAYLAKLFVRMLPYVLGYEDIGVFHGGLNKIVAQKMGGDILAVVCLDIEQEDTTTYLKLFSRSLFRGRRLGKKIFTKYAPYEKKGAFLFPSLHKSPEHYYFKSPYRSRRILVPFYDERTFASTKLGVLAHIYKRFEVFTKEYASCTFQKRRFYEHRTKSPKKIKEDMWRLIDYTLQKPVCILDYTQKPESVAFVRDFIQDLGGEVFCGEPKGEEPLIFLVHDSQHYQEQSLQDPYPQIKKRYGQSPTQALTLKTLEENPNISLRVVLKELALKDFIFRKKIPKDLWIGQDILFVSKEESGRPIALQIDKEGALSFSKEVPSQYARYFTNGDLYGVCVDKERNEEVLIYDTYLKPLPDIEKIIQKEEAMKRFITLEKSQKKSIAKAALQFCPHKEEVFAKWIKEEMSPQALSAKLGKKCTAALQRLLDSYDLSLGWYGSRSKEGEFFYLKNIWWNKEGYYFVHSIDPIPRKIATTPIMRKLSSYKEWYFALLEYGFVRYQNDTIYPYPFKLLREWSTFC